MRMGHAIPRGRAVRMLTRAAVLMTGGLALLASAGLTMGRDTGRHHRPRRLLHEVEERRSRAAGGRIRQRRGRWQGGAHQPVVLVRDVPALVAAHPRAPHDLPRDRRRLRSRSAHQALRQRGWQPRSQLRARASHRRLAGRFQAQGRQAVEVLRLACAGQHGRGRGRVAHRHGSARQPLQLFRVQHRRRPLPVRGQARHLLGPDGCSARQARGRGHDCRPVLRDLRAHRRDLAVGTADRTRAAAAGGRTLLLGCRTAGCTRWHLERFPRSRLRFPDGHARRMVL